MNVKLRKNKNGKGYVTAYTFSVGSKEARDLNFIDLEGNPLDLEKIVDIENKQLVIKLKKI